MSQQSFDVIIFDWDGTLVDSEAHIVQSMQLAASNLGLKVLDRVEIKQIIGLGMKEAILSLYPFLDKEAVNDFRVSYSDAFFREGTGPSDLFPKAIETLEHLKNQDLHLAVATGKSRNGLEKALDSTGLRPYFDITKCADETRSKPHPQMLEEIAHYFGRSPELMVMVGDTEYDLEMARIIGMPSVGVSYGVHDREALERHAPIKIVNCLSEIVQVI